MEHLREHMSNFLTSKEAQFQTIQAFLSGVAEVHAHHVSSNEHRMSQFETEFDCMASEYEVQQGSFDTTYNELVKAIREETTEANIQRLVNEAKRLKADFIPNLKGYIREIGTFSRFHPDLIDYESTVYATYLKKYFRNSEENWTVPKLWEYDVTSKYSCMEIPEEDQELLRNWLKMLEKRKLHRGQLIETAYREPEPHEKKMEIIQQYFKTQKAATPQNANQKQKKKKKQKEPKRSIYGRLNLYKTNEAAIEKFKINRTTRKFLLDAAIAKNFMSDLITFTKKKYLEIISSTQKSAKLSANARAARRKMKSEFGLKKKIDVIEPKIRELEVEIAPERLAKITQLKDGLQVQQRMASRTLNEMREKKEECTTQLNEATEALHLIPEQAEPKMQAATETSQLVELCDLAETQFQQAKNQVERLIDEYSKWSQKKIDNVKVQLRNYIKPMMQEKLLDQSDKEAIKKMESLVHKACFLYNKDLSVLLPEKIKEIEECRKRFHDEKFIPHDNDLRFIHQIDRALSNSQIQIASETSKVRQWLNNLESTVKTFCEHVENSDPTAIRVDPTTGNRVTEVLFIVNERNRTNGLLTEVVTHFMCSLSTLANVKRDFYFNWLTAKTHQEFMSLKAEEAEAKLAAKRGSSSNLLGGIRKMSSLNLAKTQSRKYSTMPGMGGGPRRIIRDPKIEVKVQIFGDFRAPNGEDLPSRMTRLLFDATNRILTLGDAYYRSRGARPITRPELIRENFERTCDFTVIKVVDFERKAKDFVHKCFLQVKDMVDRFTLTGRPVMEMIFSETNKAIQNESAKAINDVQDRYQKLFDALKDAGLEHNSKLRTSLGLPENKEELANLEKNERDRHFKIHKYNIERHTELRSKLTEIVTRDATKICALAADLMQKEEKIISDRDLLVVSYDEYDEPVIDRTFAGRPPEWPEVPRGSLPQFKCKPIKTSKASESMEDIMKFRDEVVRSIEKRFSDYQQEFDDQKAQTIFEAERWKKSWDSSIKTIKELYEVN